MLGICLVEGMTDARHRKLGEETDSHAQFLSGVVHNFTEGHRDSALFFTGKMLIPSVG
jgi:hypothetical protein